MISRHDLVQAGRLKGLSAGDAEIDYLNDLILLSVSRRTKDELVFKGGTALYKLFKLDRFSRDIDFTAVRPLDLPRLCAGISRDLAAFGAPARHDIDDRHPTALIRFRVQGPLFAGTERSAATVRMDINRKSSVLLPPLLKPSRSLYPDVPPFSLLVMDEREVLAEKVRALLTRAKARDLYDLWSLLQAGVSPDAGLVADKLAYYSDRLTARRLSESLQSVSRRWSQELAGVPSLPAFPAARRAVAQALAPLAGGKA